MASKTQGFKLRLRHLNGTLKRPPSSIPAEDAVEIIQKNLEPLKHNTKKKVAQTLYYQNHPEHQSPLTRVEKGPVHQRLGVKQIRLRRLVPLGTNTSSVLPKKKLFSKNLRTQGNVRMHNTPGQFKRHKMQRIYSAQARIERIRMQQRNNNNSVIKLRRLNGNLPPATNLTVEVKNPNFVPANNNTSFTYDGFPRFKMVLNPQIQAEILEIQKESVGSTGSLPPLTRITPVTTDVSISTRFSLL